MKIKFGKRGEYFNSGEWWESLRSDITPDAELADWDEVRKYIADKLDKIGFKSYYSQMNMGKDWIEIDFGSWTLFFLVYDLTSDDIKEFIEGKRVDK